MSNSELSVIDIWLAATLRGDPTLASLVADRVYSELAPEGAIYPFIRFWMQSSGNDVPRLGGGRIASSPLFTICGIVEGRSYQGVSLQVANAIDRLLDQKQATTTQGRIVSCVRERAFRQPETAAGGKEFRWQGGQYRIMAQAF